MKKPKKAEWYVEKKYWVKNRTDYAVLHTLLDQVYQAFHDGTTVWIDDLKVKRSILEQQYREAMKRIVGIITQPKPRKKSK